MEGFQAYCFRLANHALTSGQVCVSWPDDMTDLAIDTDLQMYILLRAAVSEIKVNLI